MGGLSTRIYPPNFRTIREFVIYNNFAIPDACFDNNIKTKVSCSKDSITFVNYNSGKCGGGVKSSQVLGVGKCVKSGPYYNMISDIICPSDS